MKTYSHLYPWQIVSRFSGVHLHVRLPTTYDVDKLRRDVDAVVAAYESRPQYRFDHHYGGWRAIGLISHEGNYLEDRPLPGTYKKTEALRAAPYIESILDSFDCDKQRVRISALLPGKNIYWHMDYKESVDSDLVRLHIPVVTSDDVEFQICHEDCRWKAGELWYGDFTFPHRVRNGGTTTRIHLVIDLVKNDKVLALLPQELLAQREKRLRVKSICRRLLKRYEEMPRLISLLEGTPKPPAAGMAASTNHGAPAPTE
jgi:hypothetical protein